MGSKWQSRSALFAALRIGMAYRIAWAAYDGRAIAWQHKTDQENWLPVDGALRPSLMRRFVTPSARYGRTCSLATIVDATRGVPYAHSAARL